MYFLVVCLKKFKQSICGSYMWKCGWNRHLLYLDGAGWEWIIGKVEIDLDLECQELTGTGKSTLFGGDLTEKSEKNCVRGTFSGTFEKLSRNFRPFVSSF